LFVVAVASFFAATSLRAQGFTIPDSGATSQWAKIGTFGALQAGETIRIVEYIHQSYTASNSEDSYTITFKTSNGISVDSNGFAGNESWYVIGFNRAIPSGNIKWKANAAGTSAISYDLYIYLPGNPRNSHYVVSLDATGT